MSPQVIANGLIALVLSWFGVHLAAGIWLAGFNRDRRGKALWRGVIPALSQALVVLGLFWLRAWSGKLLPLDHIDPSIWLVTEGGGKALLLTLWITPTNLVAAFLMLWVMWSLLRVNPILIFHQFVLVIALGYTFAALLMYLMFSNGLWAPLQSWMINLAGGAG